MKSYLNAEEVAPTWKPHASPCSGANPSSAPGWAAEPTWSTNVAASNGVTVTLTAQCRIGGDFQALYFDESQPRIILKYRDYLYPKDLRIDRSAGCAYGVASGFAGGLKLERAVLVEYDLARRRVVAEIDVDRKILPAVSWEGPTRR